MSRALIIGDGRKGHENQSIALAKHLGVGYDLVRVSFPSGVSKAAAYLFDRAGIYEKNLFHISEPIGDDAFDVVIGAGSSVYYAVKYFAKRFRAKSVAMMLPKGYRYDNFDLIFAQAHDRPPKRSNIVTVPANFAFVQPHNIVDIPNGSIGVVIGGDNRHFHLTEAWLRNAFEKIMRLFPDKKIVVTTSPRTPAHIEALTDEYEFENRVIYSRDKINPIPDMLAHCDTVVLTPDSTSMISEAVSYGRSNIAVLPFENDRNTKFSRMIEMLERGGYLSILRKEYMPLNRKIDFSVYAKKVLL